MAQYFKVTTLTTKGIQQMVLDAGWTIDGVDEMDYLNDSGALQIDIKKRDVWHFYTNQIKNDDSIISFDKFVELLETKPEPKIQIAGHVVTFHDYYIEAGCEQVTYKEIEKLNKELVERDLIKCPCVS